MVLCPMTRAYLLGSDNGRLLCGNSLISPRLGFADNEDVTNFFAAAHTAFMDELAEDGATISDFEDALFDHRFDPFVHDQPRAVREAGLGFPAADEVSLTGHMVYHVLKLRDIRHIAHRDSFLKAELNLLMDDKPRAIRDFKARWDSLTEDQRRFSLDQSFGQPIVWFTNEAGVRRAREYGRAHDLGDADAFCEMLGLGHHEKGAWMALLHIPGAAVEQANHYRPLFCDAIKHRYFMMRSSLPDAEPGPWGQTANLREVKAGAIHYDGAGERVSHQLQNSHFDDGETIFVELLGELERPAYTGAPSHLADGVWLRRRFA